MTTNQLAAGYFRKCTDRLAAFEVLMGRDAFSDVVRESQEVVDVDFIPTDSYDRDDAATAYGQARQATAALEKALAHKA